VRAARSTTIAVVAAQCFLLAAGVGAAAASHAPANARIAVVADHSHADRQVRRGELSARASWLRPPDRASHGSLSASAAAAPAPPFTQCPAVGADSTCGLLLDVTSSGVTVLEDPSQGPYDGSDDTLVGVINQSSSPINSLALTSTSPIFAFDGDGICSGFYGFLAGCPFGPTGYEGPGTSFTQISADYATGGVVFAGGIAPGATAYFSLEAPLSATSIIPSHYVALGDSVAAGEGIGYGWTWNSTTSRWEGGSSTGTWDNRFEQEECHQTTEGYPHVVADELGATLEDYACTGASAFNGVLGEQVESAWSAPAQLGSSVGLPGSAPANPNYDAAEPELVTLSLGADDVGFSKLVEECYEKACSTDQHRLDGVLATQERNLKLVLEEIQRRGVADGRAPLVMMTEYYSPFPAYDPKCIDLNFTVGPLWFNHEVLTNTEMQFLRKGEQRLNANIAKVAAAQHIVVLATDPLFKGHRWCSSNPWAYGPSLESIFHHHSAAPFHPTPEGQQAIGQALAALASARLPVNTGPSVYVGLPYGSLDFANVASAGEAAIIPAGDLPGSTPPASTFALSAAYDITTSATYSGPIIVSLPSSTPLSLFHYVQGEWHEVPSTFNGSYVTGEVESLSPFALGTAVSPVHARLAPANGGEAPAAVHFDASASSVENESAITSYAWDFGDEETGSGATPTHVYRHSGTYQVTVTVTAEDGAVNTASQEVTITHAAPSAQASGPASGSVGQALTFASPGSTASGGPYEATWEFGDGSQPSEGATAEHAFSAPGNYEVTLLIRDDEGELATATLPLAIAAATANGASGGTGSKGVLGTHAQLVARISIGHVLRRGRHGRLLVQLRCAAGASKCTGVVRLRVKSHGRLAVLGTARYAVRASASAWVAFMPSKALARTARASSLKAQVLVSEPDGVAVSGTATLPRPASHHHQLNARQSGDTLPQHIIETHHTG
jgi:PKD repeat protein